MKNFDAVVVGSGPNGLAAAITMARVGCSVIIYETAAVPGGGVRSETLTVPGFLHDLCSAVHPMAVTSSFFRSLPLEKFGLQWIHSPVALAHPFDHREPALLYTSIDKTVQSLEKEDQENYLKLMEPLTKNWENLFSEVSQPIFHWPRHPWILAQFGLKAIQSAESFTKINFSCPTARALFSGIAAHSNTPLKLPATAAVGIMLNVAAHAQGWPIPRGGSQKIAESLIQYFESLGGTIQTSSEVRSLKDLPKSRFVFFDLTPRQILSIAGELLSDFERKSLEKFRYGPGVFKMDWALSDSIPWSATQCQLAATVHLGGSAEEIFASEAAPIQGQVVENPYVLLSQPSLFDPTRAPIGQHTAWAYCHVPHSSREDQTSKIENQIERFAPGFKKLILGRSSLSTRDLSKKNANLVGGDISGGAASFTQLIFRPRIKANPYELSVPGFYICSASTPPGPGVHGMCGMNAALSALKNWKKEF
jgi:phytoene dehydrogenase-like protein